MNTPTLKQDIKTKLSTCVVELIHLAAIIDHKNDQQLINQLDVVINCLAVQLERLNRAQVQE